MKVKLNVQERITLLGLLPKEGNFATLKILRDLQNDLSFTQKELGYYKIRQTDTQILWDIKKGQEGVEKDFGKYEIDLIIKALEELDKKEKLESRHFSLYEKFVTK